MSKNQKTYVKKTSFNKFWALVIALIFALVGGVVVWRSFAETYTATNFTPVGIASNHTDNGYWLVAADGGVFSYGSAHFYGSMGGKAINAPIVGMAATPDGGGYWLVGSDGAVYAFGDAKYEGGVNSPASASSPLATAYGEYVVGISSTTTGDNGYYIVSNFGEVWAYGNAPGSGQNGCLVVSRRGSPYIYGQSYVQNPLVDPVVGIATDPSGGIWTEDANGGVFSYNGASYFGSMGGKTLNKPMVGITPASDGGGYWLTAGDGGVFAFGSSEYQGRVYYGSTSTSPTSTSPTSTNTSSSSNSTSSTKTNSGQTTTKTVNGITLTYVNGNPVSSGTVSASASGYLNPTEAKIPQTNAPIVSGLATSNDGYWLEGADGGIFSEGSSQYHGSMGGKTLNSQIVGIAKTKDNGGYWLVGSDGGVFSFGDAHYYGSMGGKHLNGSIVGIAATPDGGGYWLVGSDGGVFSFGDAHYYGSMGGKQLNASIVGIAATPDGGGYWLVGSDGGVFSFGDAHYYGSMGGKNINKPVVGMASTSDGKGYWLVASDGGVFSFGDAHYYGSMGGRTDLVGWVTSISPTPNDNGYYLFGSDGGVFGFGNAKYEGRVVYPPPSLTMTATPSLIQLGQSTTLSWSTTNSDLATIEVEGSQVHGPYASSGSINLTPTSYGTYDYKLIVIGAGGYVTKSITLNVLPPKPTAQIYSVPVNGASEICWNSTWAGSVNISLLGDVGDNGCKVWTAPSSPGKYYLTITAVGYGGTTTYTDPQPIMVYAPSSSGSVNLTNTAASGSSTINIPSATPKPGDWQQLLVAPLGYVYLTSASATNYVSGNNTYSTTKSDFVCFDFNYGSTSEIKGSFSLNYKYDYHTLDGGSASFSSNNETDYLNTNHIVKANNTGTDCEPLQIADAKNQIGIINFNYEYHGLPTGISFRGVRLIGGFTENISKLNNQPTVSNIN